MTEKSEHDLKKEFSLEGTASVKEIADAIENTLGKSTSETMNGEPKEVVSVRLTDEYYGKKAKEKLKKLKSVSDIDEITEDSYCIVEIKYKENGITRKMSFETVEIGKKWYIYLHLG